MIVNTSLSFVDSGNELTLAQACAWCGLVATYSDVARQLDATLRASHQIGLSAYETLLRLGQAPNCCLRMSELAAVAPLTLSGVSRMIDRLERAGLARREASPEDGRVACAMLTSEGQVRLRDAHQTYLSAVRRLFLDRLDEQEIEALNRCWGKLGACPPVTL